MDLAHLDEPNSGTLRGQDVFDEMLAEAQKKASVEMAKGPLGEGGTFDKRKVSKIRKQDSMARLDFAMNSVGVNAEKLIYKQEPLSAKNMSKK